LGKIGFYHAYISRTNRVYILLFTMFVWPMFVSEVD